MFGVAPDPAADRSSTSSPVSPAASDEADEGSEGGEDSEEEYDEEEHERLVHQWGAQLLVMQQQMNAYRADMYHESRKRSRRWAHQRDKMKRQSAMDYRGSFFSVGELVMEKRKEHGRDDKRFAVVAAVRPRAHGYEAGWAARVSVSLLDSDEPPTPFASETNFVKTELDADFQRLSRVALEQQASSSDGIDVLDYVQRGKDEEERSDRLLDLLLFTRPVGGTGHDPSTPLLCTVHVHSQRIAYVLRHCREDMVAAATSHAFECAARDLGIDDELRARQYEAWLYEGVSSASAATAHEYVQLVGHTDPSSM